MRHPVFRFIQPLVFAVLALLALTAGLQFAHAQTGSFGGNPTLIWPLSGSSQADTASSPFGPRWQASQSRYDYHPGIDLPAPQNWPVHVITDGIVSEVGWLSASSGLAVVVYHPALDLYSAYLHLNSTDVALDDSVTQGQVIGAVGDTGITDFMHLHFEIRLTRTNYPTSTRNPLGYLPHPDVTTPTIRIGSITSDPIYSPTVSLVITAARTELDVNIITVTVRDKTTGAVVDARTVDLNQRIPTGSDTLATIDAGLQPSAFNTSTLDYKLTANFNLHVDDGFTLTAEVADLAGHTASVTRVADDTTPPARVQDLSATRQPDGGVALRWTAPGDSNMVGAAALYDIRYSAAPIDSFTWYSATQIASLPAPLPGGAAQTFTVAGPLPSPVYFGLKTSDSEGNWSLLSNSAQARTAWRIFLPLIIK